MSQPLGIPGGQLDEHRAVEQRLLIAMHGGDQVGHVLQVYLRRDRLLHVVGVAAVQTVFVGGVVDDLLLLRRRDQPGIDVQRHAAVLPQTAEERQFLRAGGIPPQGQCAVVGAAQDKVVRVELHRRRRDLVQEAQGWYSCILLFFAFLPICHSTFSIKTVKDFRGHIVGVINGQQPHNVLLPGAADMEPPIPDTLFQA